ncbi:helix-turn-helix domain-containing protein [Streptomyces wuyuanensis]|uniref:helix-turn-helix domain-containing protein n=1 Tax=Streptomyces wuyuanensis TaxID=1196353 RepID=UPI003791BE38
MSQKIAGLPQLHSAADVAQALGCSEWWVKEQARRGRIPFTKPAGSYRFTDEHFAEIMRIFESRPAQTNSAAVPAAPAPRRRAVTTAVAVAPLKARTPRRARHSQSQSSAA